MLNVAAGADNSIVPVIDAADAYLMLHEIGSAPGDDEGRQYALGLKDALVAYNEQGCPEDESAGGEKSATSVEKTDWGSLKALYK